MSWPPDGNLKTQSWKFYGCKAKVRFSLPLLPFGEVCYGDFYPVQKSSLHFVRIVCYQSREFNKQTNKQKKNKLWSQQS